MDVRVYDLKQKGMINVETCKRLGFVGGMDFDTETGCLLTLTVPRPGCIYGFLSREKEYVILFCNICQVGNDIILVDIKEKGVTENIKCWMEIYNSRKGAYSADSREVRALFSLSGRRSDCQGFPCRPVCKKKLYEKYLLFTNLTMQTNREGFIVEV